MDTTEKQSPGASKSPVGSPGKEASKSPVGSPGKEASKSPVGSPGKEASESPEQQRSPSPTSGGDLLPGTYWTEAALPDDDEGLDDLASSTASLSSSVMHYRTVQGRTYHSSRGNAEYWGSNDEKQNEALDLFHHAFTVVLGGEIHLAPLKDDIKKAVDVGTGTGLWAIDFADKFPDCEVIGTDVSPIQPTWIPPNLKFEIDDFSRPWTFEADSLDYVHLRYLTGCVQDWPTLFKEAYRCTTPGGYIESFDARCLYESDDGVVPERSALAQWGKLVDEGGKVLGRSFDTISDDTQRRGMEDAGYVVEGQRDVKMPIGTWPKDPKMKEIGMCIGSAVHRDIEGFVTYLATLLDWPAEAILVFAAHVRREIRDPNIHCYFRMRVVWGRKPGY